MKSGVPWQVQVRPEARETAREAARRSGMSVSEWLDSLIIDSASREGIEPAPGAPAHLSTDDYPDWDRDPLPPRRPYADDDRRHRPVARDDRPEPAAYHDTSRLPGPRERPALDPGIAEVNQRLDNLTRQLDQLARLNVANAKASASRQDEAPRHLTDAISKLDRRLDQLVAEGRSATSEIERRMSAVDRVVADLGQQKPRPAVVANPPTPLDQALMEIADRQRALDGHPPAPAVRAPTAAQAPAAVQTPAAVPAPTPSEALPRARTQEFSGLERELRQINTQIQALSRPCNIDSAVGKAVDTLRDDLAEIGVMLQDALPRKAVEALEGQVRKLSERIDNTRDAGVDGGAVAGVERGLMEVRDALRGLTPAESLVGVDQAVKELSRKIDMIGGGSQDPAALKQLESAIVAMRGIVSHVASNDALARLSDEVRSLADKVEHVGSGGGSDVLSSLERRIGSLADALEARNRHGHDVPRDIDDVVKGLIDKIDRLQISRGDHAAFGHLDERIALLVEKLDASDARLNHLEALERGLAELLIHLEHQRLPHLAGAAANPPPEVDALNRDVADLKEIEKKTQDSLEAFHGTLGHVVERLAMIETDMRGMTTQERAAPAAPAAPLAPRLAPAVAPAELPIAPPSPPPRPPEVETAAAAPEEEDFTALDEEVAAAPHHAAANPVPAPANERRPIDPNLPPDHPLEPGVARLRHPASPADRIAASEAALGPAKPPVIPDPGGGKPNFIAAARSAAQAAAGEAPARARPAEQPAGDSKAGKIASLLRRHARSLIVGLSVMAIVLGTLHMAATWLRSSEEPEMEAPSRPEKSTPPTAAVPSPAPPDEAPAAAAPEKPPSGRQSALAPALDPAPAAPPASGMLLAIETARQAMNTPALKAANAAPAPTAPAHPAPAPVARAADVPAPAAPAAPAPPAAPALVLLPPPDPPALAIPAPAPLPPAVTAQAAAAQPAATTPATGTDRLPATIGGALRAAAAKGEAAAEFEIASRYAEGRGMAQNFTEAAHWFERAAKQGLAPAQFRLAGLHEKGVGVRKDLDAARRLYLAAGEAGHAKALHNLAVLYAEGIDGKPDYLSAAKWFRKAADHGIADSQYNLGILYARGIGVQQNLTEAYRWLAIAAREGDSEAAKKRDDVGARLDERSLTAARAVLQTWTPEPQPEAATQVKTPAGGWDTAAAVAAPAPKRKPPAAGSKFDLSIPRPAQ